MGHYLTNTPLRNKSLVEEAARISGMNVVFEDTPMPHDPHDYDMRYYDRGRLMGYYGSVFTYENGNHSPFWEAFRALEEQARLR